MVHSNMMSTRVHSQKNLDLDDDFIELDYRTRRPLLLIILTMESPDLMIIQDAFPWHDMLWNSQMSWEHHDGSGWPEDTTSGTSTTAELKDLSSQISYPTRPPVDAVIDSISSLKTNDRVSIVDFPITLLAPTHLKK